MQQWMLARPEIREFLPTRVMVAYPEPWMDRVDAMKKLQGWTDTSVLHFRDLGVFGEQILLVDPLRRLEQRRSTASRPATGRASGGRRSRATSTPTAPSPASTCRPTCRTSATRSCDRTATAARVPPAAPARRTAAAVLASARRRPGRRRGAGSSRAGRGLRAPRRAARPPTAEQSTRACSTSPPRCTWACEHPSDRWRRGRADDRRAGGAPAAGGTRRTSPALAALQGCEPATLAPSTLHLSWDLFWRSASAARTIRSTPGRTRSPAGARAGGRPRRAGGDVPAPRRRRPAARPARRAAGADRW